MSPAPAASWLTETSAVLRHEARLLLNSPLTYVFQVGFLAATTACIFLIADFYASDEATIRPLLVFLPWVGLIFVPALGMRAWSEGHGDTGVELLLTLPLRLSAIVAGKFLAGYAVLLITLAFTAPFAFSVFYLGEPDPGAVIAGYLAAALLLGAYYAIALLAAALSREQIGAFVGALTGLFVLLLPGWDVLDRLLKDRVSPAWRDALANLSPKTWLDALGRGLLDLAGVGYFVLLGLLALWAAAAVIGARRRHDRGARVWLRHLAFGLAGLLVLATATQLAGRVPLAIDLSAEQEYSLHAGTRAVVSGLAQDTRIVLYWSETETEVPAGIRTHARRIHDLLRAMVRVAPGRLSLETIDPQPDTDQELEALAQGIRRVPMSSGDHFYLGATFHSGERALRIAYFDMRRDRMAEYDIAVMLNSLARARAPRVAILSPLLAPTTVQRDREGLSFMSELRKSYDLAVVPYFGSELPAGIDVLVLIQPVILQKKMLYAIDQFLMAGGRVIAMLDPFVRFDQGVNQASFEPSAEINDLSDLLLRYGVTYVHDRVVGDRRLAATVSKPDGGSLAFPFWLRIGAQQLAEGHPVTASLNELLLADAGELRVEAGTGFEPLITTSERSGSRSREDFATRTPDQLALAFEAQEQRRVLALVGHGRLRSAFETPPDEAPREGHLRRSEPTARLFVVADADWLFDPFSLQSVSLGEQTILRPLNDNLALLLNMIEFASGDAALLSIRSRGRLQRPFSRVEDLFREAQERYREQEAQLVRRLAELEQRTGTPQPDAAPDADAAATLERQRELLPLRRELRSIRRRIRESVDRLGLQITAANLLAGPALVAALAVLVKLRRNRARRAPRAYATD